MTPRAPEQLPAEYRRPRPQLERNASTQSKLSLPTSSQSNEADDEQSFSDGSYMESNATDPQYEGEDTRLTSDKELSGFYMYGWAAEVCLQFPSSTSFLPLMEKPGIICCRPLNSSPPSPTA
jgi:UMF1 family MFS transporter